MADQTPARVLINDRPHWLWPDGFTFPVISGAADGDGDGGGGSGGAGAGGDGGSGGDGGGDGGSGGGGGDDDALGDAGKKALNEERSARRKAEKDARDARAELDKIRNENASEHDKALAKAKEEGKTEALSVANERLLKAEVKSAAAGKLADPGDAVRMLDLTQFKVDDNGDVDDKAISSAIDELVKEKPYLAAKGGRPSGDGGGGPRGTPAGQSFNDQIRAAARRT